MKPNHILLLGIVTGVVIQMNKPRWKYMLNLRTSELRRKVWPVTAPLEAKIGVRKMADTFPEEWLDGSA